MSVVEPDPNWPEDEGGGAAGGTANTNAARWGRLGGIAAVAAMSVGFAVAAWYALQRPDLDPAATVRVPLVKAEAGAVKEKPENPGGLKILNQDKLVYERITPKAQAPMAEKLAPAPEEPIIKPKAETKIEAVEATAWAPAAPVVADPKEKSADNKKTISDDVMAAKSAAKKPVETPDVKAPEKVAMATVDKAESAVREEKPAPKTESLLPAAKPGEAALPTLNAEPKVEPMAAPKTVPKAKAAPKLVETSATRQAKAKPEVEMQTVATTPAAKASIVKSATPRKKTFRIQIAAYRSAEKAQTAWSRLRKTHGAILGSLPAHTQRVDLGKRGVYFRVQAGSFPTARAAWAACAKLKAKRQDCIIVLPK